VKRALWPGLLVLAACAGSTASEEREARPFAVGEQRSVALSYLRFDVTNFEKTLDREALLGLPREVRERLWLLDLDLSNGPNAPQLLDRTLAAIRQLDPNTLAPAERNMQALLRMTPDTANLAGTSIATLVDLAPLLGVAPERVLADLFTIDVEDAFLSDDQLANALIPQVIGTHPNAQTRLGPKTDQNPQGVYPVSLGGLPVTLTDLATNFETFGRRFGPYDKDGRQHPGFVSDIRASVLAEDFSITVRANANALPYKGIDLTDGSVASVSSVRSQIEGLFDFQDPNWMRVQGLVPGEPTIDSLTLRVVEAPEFVRGGQSPIPQGIGSSPGWQLPPWTLERVLLGAAQQAYHTLNSQIAYAPAGETEPLFSAQVTSGFQDIYVQGGIGSPPQASYVWDLLLEVAQVRLHDGGLLEGQGDVAFTLRDVPLGTTSAELEARVKENLRASPSSLLDLTERVLANTSGAADFYYYRARNENAVEQQGDWLYFVVPGDIADDDEGKPVRAYAYAHPGFYTDAALTNKVSSLVALDGDTEHEKVRLDDHPRLYVEDDTGAVFQLARGDKGSSNHLTLEIERVR
jgi:hypothetical protein